MNESTNEPVATCKQSLHVWVIPHGKGKGQFSWDPQDERFWIRMEPTIKQSLTVQKEQTPALWVNPNLDKVCVDKNLALKNGLYIPLYTHPQDQKKDEALRLALEALKDFDYDKRIAAITLIEQALENK